MALAPGDPRHGSVGGYTNHHCRCPLCTEAWRADHAAYLAAHPEQREKQRERERRRRWELGAVPLAAKRSPRWPLCSVEDCTKDAVSKTMCHMHYKRLLRHGDPSVVRGRWDDQGAAG